MTDPLFASMSQLWPVGPPAFGVVQPVTQSYRTGPPAIGPAGMAAASAAQPVEPHPFASAVTPVFAGPGSGPGAATFASPPLAGAMPILTGSDIAIGVTAPALLTAVAMRRGQPLGPANDQEIEDFIYDALDLLPGTNDVEVRVEGGRATLTGAVPHKRLKRDVGEIAWAIPTLNDVQNTVTITARRRSRASREGGETPAVPGRKQT